MKTKKIVIAIDSFKGSLSSLAAGKAMSEGVLSVWPGAEIDVVPVGDGGEGTAEALADALGARMVTCAVHGPLMEDRDARYALSADGTTAVMEMAEAAGLTLVPPEKRNPMHTTTFGFGEMIADALRRGARRILVGIGGSATVDGGAGMLTALGFRFFGKDNEEISAVAGADLENIARIEGSAPAAEFVVACDVDNPLCGPRGAACVFGPQKGAVAADVARLDAGLGNFASALSASGYGDVRFLPGAGAAGGLGAALASALGARLEKGIDMVLEAVDFDSRLEGADLVITGEGRLDCQTAMGKTPLGILNAARRKGIPVIAVGGSVDAEADLSGFAAVCASAPENMPLAEAMRPEVARRNIVRAVAHCISHLPS